MSTQSQENDETSAKRNSADDKDDDDDDEQPHTPPDDYQRVAVVGPLVYERLHKYKWLQPTPDNEFCLYYFGNATSVAKERLRWAKQKDLVIHPLSRFRYYWDIVLFVHLWCNLLVTPVLVAFFTYRFTPFTFAFNTTLDVVNILELLLSFRTGVILTRDRGIELTRKAIRRHYMRSWFLLDLIAALPFDLVLATLAFALPSFGITPTSALYSARALRVLKLTRLGKLLNVGKMGDITKRIMQAQADDLSTRNLMVVVLDIAAFLFYMLTMGHWMACLLFIVPMIDDFPDDSWVHLGELENSDWWTQYTEGFFKSTSHILCIGYGSSAPLNVPDTWITIFSMLFGATIFAVFIGNATALITELNISEQRYREKIEEVEDLMEYRKFPNELREKIYTYYENRFSGKMFDENDIFRLLTENLHMDILRHNCRDLIKSMRIWSDADPVFIDEVVMMLRFEFFQGGDLIVKEGDLGDKMYFIEDGTVEVYVSKAPSPTVLAFMDKGRYFGEICLVMKTKRTAGIRAQSNCHMYSLSKADVDLVLERWPDERRKLEESTQAHLKARGGQEQTLEDVERSRQEVISAITRDPRLATHYAGNRV